MPETQTPPPPFGQIVAVAQRALSAALDGLLGEAGTTFQRWAALNMLAARGSAPLDALRREVAEALQADERSIAELFDQLESDGLIQTAGDRGAPDGTRIELTAGGETLHRSLRESIGRLSARILGGLDPHDIGTTIRTLREVTERAQSLPTGQPART
jgi:DNA-binding MarR family transcriptional regulator